MRILVLGGYGLIGLSVSKRLMADGFEVTGVARSAAKGQAFLPGAEWRPADIAKLSEPEHWRPFLDSIDMVVNAAGVLQNGLNDDVAATQRGAISALITACEQAGIQKFIQISALGATKTASTLFFRTKADADDALMNSRLNWTIFRPALVVAPNAYGGTSLLRMLAAFPLVQPLVMPQQLLQTVFIDDVAQAVSDAAADALDANTLSGGDYVLAEPAPQTLSELLLNIRAWLGFRPPLFTVPIPGWIGAGIAKAADAAGWLGWRSALRSTALAVLKNDVVGDPEPWAKISGGSLKSLSQTLGHMPSTAQDRIYARAKLIFPLILILLSGFWLTSGVIGLLSYDRAVSALGGALPPGAASMSVIAGSCIDMAIGAALLFRPLTRAACLVSVLVAAGYLIGGAIFTPHLWSDPLGPMVKVFPAIGLALITASLAEER